MCPKRTFPSDFVKLGSEIHYLFLAEKMVVFLFVCLLQLCSIFFELVLVTYPLDHSRRIYSPSNFRFNFI